MPVPHLAVERYALLGERARRRQFTLRERQQSQEARRCRNPFLETYLIGEDKTFVEQSSHSRQVAHGNKERLRQLRKQVGHTHLVLALPVERQTLLKHGTRPRVFTLAAGEQSKGEERVSDVIFAI